MPLPQSMLSEYGPAAVARGYNTYNERVARDKRKYGTAATTRAIGLPVAAMAAGPMLASILAPGAAAGAATGGSTAIPAGFSFSPAVSSAAGAAATAGRMGSAIGRLGSIFSHPGFQTGANAALSLFGMRQQNKANDQARTDALAREATMLELERQRLAAELRNQELDREDARAVQAAMQEMERRKHALEQERLAFDRAEYEKREARLEPYRRIQSAAAQQLASILGLG